jgi:hypothetical protein
MQGEGLARRLLAGSGAPSPARSGPAQGGSEPLVFKLVDRFCVALLYGRTDSPKRRFSARAVPETGGDPSRQTAHPVWTQRRRPRTC